MSTVWILGAGQLGAMLGHAGQPLAIDVRPVPLDASDPPVTAPTDVVSPEIEHWPDTPATRVLAEHPGLVNRGVFARLADRFTQKSLIDELALATAPWRLVEADTTEQQLYHSLGERVLLKQRRGGYDGRGQHWLRQARGDAIPPGWREIAIAESGIDFDEEVSLVGMRDRRGRKAFYPLTLNLHRDGILAASIAPLQRLQPLQARAEGMLGALLDRLEYTGVMAMECFGGSAAYQRVGPPGTQQWSLDPGWRHNQPVRKSLARHLRSAHAHTGAQGYDRDDQPDRHRAGRPLAGNPPGGAVLVW